ncbi:MAG: hypothetical protein PHQ43_11345, partial [Dehalococcoidales bacterium]|nr:hypothetical protein [Dehalococcoidales bacterium]
MNEPHVESRGRSWFRFTWYDPDVVVQLDSVREDKGMPKALMTIRSGPVKGSKAKTDSDGRLQIAGPIQFSLT